MKINKKYTLKLDFLYFNCETTKKKIFCFSRVPYVKKDHKKKKKREREKSEQTLES